MNEISQNPLAVREPGAPESAAPVANAKIEQAWLRELERAQWQQRPADVRRGPPAADGKGARGPAERAAPRAAAPAQSTEAWVASRAARAGAAASAASAAPRPPLGERAGPAAPETAPAAPAAGEASAALRHKAAPGFAAQVAARLWGEPRKWDPRRVHARERGGRVWIWIRDAQFDASQIGRLAASLAQLARDAGLGLEGITVNGHVVFGPAPGGDPYRAT